MGDHRLGGAPAICTVEAAGQLAALGAADRISVLVAATASISVLILIAVSSTDARRWVAPVAR